MNRAERRKQKREKTNVTRLDTNINSRRALIDHIVSEFSVAVLYTIRKELKFGRKRGKRISDAIMNTFDGVISGKLDFKTMAEIVESEMGVRIVGDTDDTVHM